MGAYYQATIEQEGEEAIRYNTHDAGSGLKLMEHSYISNEYVERIMSMLFDKSSLLTWVCDYTEGTYLDWGKTKEETKEKFLENSYEIMSTYIILNHTQGLKIDIKKLICLNKERMFIIHPLPILCNSEKKSMGGGDYHNDESLRGTWAGDEIEITYDENLNEEYEDVTEDVIFYE